MPGPDRDLLCHCIALQLMESYPIGYRLMLLWAEQPYSVAPCCNFFNFLIMLRILDGNLLCLCIAVHFLESHRIGYSNIALHHAATFATFLFMLRILQKLVSIMCMFYWKWGENKELLGALSIQQDWSVTTSARRDLSQYSSLHSSLVIGT